jgi:GNAT superfamily N-acetyltransferase
VAITVRRLDATHAGVVKQFDCGDLDLNDYLKRYALKNQARHMVGMTYVAISEAQDRVVGYYTIANTSISRTRMPYAALVGFPKYADIPAILLGRFAVDADFQKRGVGQLLMSHALHNSLSVAEISAARYLVTEAYASAVPWYKKYDFHVIDGGEPNRIKMYLDLKVVKKAQQAATVTLFKQTGS